MYEIWLRLNVFDYYVNGMSILLNPEWLIGLRKTSDKLSQLAHLIVGEAYSRIGHVYQWLISDWEIRGSARTGKLKASEQP